MRSSAQHKANALAVAAALIGFSAASQVSVAQEAPGTPRSSARLRTAATPPANALGATGTLSLVSSNAAGAPLGGDNSALEGEQCGLSADGNLVLFNSNATGLVPGGGIDAANVYLKNIRTGAVTRVSPGNAGGANCIAMTPDGNSVLFRSPYFSGDIFVKNIQTGALTKVTPAPTSIPNNVGFVGGSISDDGAVVAFVTVPTSHYIGQYDYANDVPARVVVKNLRSNTQRIIIADDGNPSNGEVVSGGRLSPDGNKVVFTSTSKSLVPNDTNGQEDVFVRDLNTGSTQLVTGDASGAVATPIYSGFLMYYNEAFVTNDLVRYQITSDSSLGGPGTYLKSLSSRAINLALAVTDGFAGRISSDGGKMAFLRIVSGSFAYRAVVRNLRSGAEAVVSTSTAGVIGNGGVNGLQISRDGSTVVFGSNASNLVSPALPAGSVQVYAKKLPF